MGGFFGVASGSDCVADLFYGTDYHSHLGTRRGGMVVRNERGFKRSTHDISNAPFRTKSEEDLPKHHGNLGIGVISDTEDQPLLIAAHHAHYAIVTVGRIDNLHELAAGVLNQRGTQLRDLMHRVFELGATEVHMRAACPPLLHSCKFLNFSRSSSVMELAARKAIQQLEGDANCALDEYSNASTERYQRMVEVILEHLGLTTLRYQTPPDMVAALGLPPESICTYCWDGKEGPGPQASSSS